VPEKTRLQAEGNKGVGEGQGYEGDGHAQKKFFRITANPLLHMELRACNNSPFVLAFIVEVPEPEE
jgi:hypothetical protein